MKNTVELLSSYGSYHTKDITKITHFIGVPSIYLGVLILLCWVHVPVINISLAWLAVISLVIYYLMLDLNLGLIATAVLMLMTYLAQLIAGEHFNMTAFIIFAVLFVFGWVAQLVGHHYEGNRPAFLDNILQVFAAPFYLVAEAVFYFGYRKDLQQKIAEKMKAG